MQSAAFVERRVDDAAAILLDRHDHTAVVKVIDVLSVADAQVGGDDLRAAAVGEGDDTAGVYGAWVQLHERLVLNDALLKNERTHRLEMLIKVALKLGSVYLFYALTAHSARGLCHENGVLCRKLRERRPVGGTHIEPVTVHKFAEILGKLELVLDLRHILGVVVALNKCVIFAPREYGLALAAVEIVHLEQPVIHISRLIDDTAIHHVEEDKKTAFARLFMHLVNFSEHLTVVHIKYTAYKILELRHSEPPFGAWYCTTRRRKLQENVPGSV